ncbi:MAG: oxygen-dependent coproporphyrinogen oxidase [Bacteroidetes bacterium]|nr:oxygen-dependent coproporphyrinogen oxidase [Bacteroidota bacterium]
MKSQFTTYIKDLQNRITTALAQEDGLALFREDKWQREGGGGGRTRVIENGSVFEKGGVNISEVFGSLPESMQKQLGVSHTDFFACGISLVLHPKNPMVPTVHANFRYFELYDGDKNVVDQWFGGGLDLTPYYLFEEDAALFHGVCKAACDAHDASFYTDYKKKCDAYFWNHHRDEARGIGGLFFDYCRPNEVHDLASWYAFITQMGDAFLDAYLPIVQKRKILPYTDEQRQWQEIRRGRYVEFNLVHDKGTLFGLKTKGRIESILMSLPPTVQWVYDVQPKENTEEAKLITVLKNPKTWV